MGISVLSRNPWFLPGVFETRFRILYRQHYRNIILKNVTTIFRTLKTDKQLRRF